MPDNREKERQAVKNPANRCLRLRLYPTLEQEILIGKTIGCARKIYNLYLEDYRAHRGDLEHKQPALTEFKKQYPYMYEVDSQALSNSHMDYNRAWENRKKNPKHFGRPKRKRRRAGNAGSYTTCLTNNNIEVTASGIKLPKLKMVKTDGRTLPMGAILKKVTVIKEPDGRYYAAVGYHIPESENKENIVASLLLSKMTGLDYSSSEFFVNECGITPEEIKYFRKYEKKLAHEQKKLSRQKKGSKRYEKQRKRIARLHKKIANKRRDFHNKVVFAIAKHYLLVGVEDLNLNGMSARRGFKLGKSVHDNGYSEFLALLQRKLDENGGKLVKVSKWFPSTNTCSCCGHRLEGEDKLSLSDRVFVCPECGSVLDRDRNSAVNIEREALCLFLEEEGLLVRFDSQEKFSESDESRVRDTVVVNGLNGSVLCFDGGFAARDNAADLIHFCAGGTPVSGDDMLGAFMGMPVASSCSRRGCEPSGSLKRRVVSVSDVSYYAGAHDTWNAHYAECEESGATLCETRSSNSFLLEVDEFRA